MMKLLVLAAGLMAVVSSLPAQNYGVVHMANNELSVDEVWADFKLKHGKQYDTVEEEYRRQLVFLENKRKIDLHNNNQHLLGAPKFTLAVNQFADMETSEFATMMNGYKMGTKSTPSEAATYMSPLAEMTLPKTVDWRTKGYVTEVKNQAQCGSCWAFSTTGSLEGQHFRKTGKLVSLSEQNLVDCSKNGNEGCEGGLMDTAFKYIKTNGGIDTEESYPYTARDQKCKFTPKNVGATDTGFVDVPSGDEKALQNASATVGPISVAIDASHFSFQFYHTGVYYANLCSSTQLDHGVLVVGYGSENGKDYWLVKNSWGTGWGIHGYIKMSRNRNNNCGIATNASYPLV